MRSDITDRLLAKYVGAVALCAMKKDDPDDQKNVGYPHKIKRTQKIKGTPNIKITPKKRRTSKMKKT